MLLASNVTPNWRLRNNDRELANGSPKSFGAAAAASATSSYADPEGVIYLGIPISARSIAVAMDDLLSQAAGSNYQPTCANGPKTL